MKPLIDSTPFARDPGVLRSRAAEHGYLWLRGIPGPEAVAPLCTLIQDIAEPLGLLWPARDARTAPLVRPGAALTGTGYDDPRWLRSRSACSPILVSPLSATSPV